MDAARKSLASLKPQEGDRLIQVGFCGAIREEIPVGEVLLSEPSLTLDPCSFWGAAGEEGTFQSGELCLMAGFPATLLSGKPGSSRESREGGNRGVLAGVSQLLESKAQKLTLAQAFPEILGVEMESLAGFEFAKKHGLPFSILRSVSDPSNFTFPLRVDQMLDSTMRKPAIPGIFLHLLRRPSRILPLLQLAKNSRIAARALARSLCDLLNSLR